MCETSPWSFQSCGVREVIFWVRYGCDGCIVTYTLVVDVLEGHCDARREGYASVFEMRDEREIRRDHRSRGPD